MAERRIGDFHLAPSGWGMDSDIDEDEDLDFPLGGEIPSEQDFAFCLPAPSMRIPPTN